MIIVGDSAIKLLELPDNSIDAVVTDPPYGLSFMGKAWDYDVPSVELWKQVLRVLKPGGHLLSFGGTRTYHRMVVNIEDAGFHIRDQIMWLYGQGFPKSLDISKALDKMAGAERKVISTIKKTPSAAKCHKGWERPWAEGKTTIDITLPSTQSAKQWAGWGTALKPANEPICLARKPISESTVAKNVLKWGTGGINVEASRIGPVDIGLNRASRANKKPLAASQVMATTAESISQSLRGRFPANLLLDEEAAAALDAQSGMLQADGHKKPSARGSAFFGSASGPQNHTGRPDAPGGASRFFYVAKASQAERDAGLAGRVTHDGRTKSIDNAFLRAETERKNHHPTVKPIKLMEYLCRLVTPPGGVVLDPFMGSGSTGVAAINLSFKFIGIEMEPEYAEIARLRIHDALEIINTDNHQLPLFTGADAQW